MNIEERVMANEKTLALLTQSFNSFREETKTLLQKITDKIFGNGHSYDTQLKQLEMMIKENEEDIKENKGTLMLINQQYTEINKNIALLASKNGKHPEKAEGEKPDAIPKAWYQELSKGQIAFYIIDKIVIVLVVWAIIERLK